jgi:MFS family permease
LKARVQANDHLPFVQNRWRNVALLNGVSGLTHLAQFGVIYTLLAMWLESRGMITPRIGMVVASVWVGMLVGMLVGNLLTPMLLTRFNARTIALFSCVGTALWAFLVPNLPSTEFFAWLGAAALFGFLVGLRWVSVEGWAFELIDGPHKARLIAVHESIIYAAQALGPVCIGVVGLLDGSAFQIASATAAAAVLPLMLTTQAPRACTTQAARQPLNVLKGIWQARRSDPSIALGVLSGITDGALLGMLSVHLLRAGQSQVNTSMMLVVFGAGGLLSQFPLGWLADRKGVESANRATSLIGFAGTALLLLNAGLGVWAGAAFLGVLAACGLTLSIIAATERAKRTQGDMVIAIARVSIAFTVGSAFGPLLAGFAMTWSERFALPAITAAACWGFWFWAAAGPCKGTKTQRH